MAEIRRTAVAVWAGDFRGGTGRITSNSGVLKDTFYSFAIRFEDKPGTNPEELIAAAHAACYSMALAVVLGSKGLHPERIETRATCILSPRESGGFKITGMHLDVQGDVPGIDNAEFQRIAQEADRGCPVSNLLRPGLTIELDANLR